MLANIEAERARMGYTKDKMSKAIGVSQTTYCSYVNEATPIPSNVLLKLGQVCDCSIDYLLGMSESRRNISTRP